MNMQPHHPNEEILRALRRNKWTVGYVAVITTVGLVLKIIELVKG